MFARFVWNGVRGISDSANRFQSPVAQVVGTKIHRAQLSSSAPKQSPAERDASNRLDEHIASLRLSHIEGLQSCRIERLTDRIIAFERDVPLTNETVANYKELIKRKVYSIIGFVGCLTAGVGSYGLAVRAESLPPAAQKV